MDFTKGEVLYVAKPLNWTSFNLVNKIRWKLQKTLKMKKLKVGHAGTLDPLATGLMIICTGKATKLIETFQYQTKEYIATLGLGATTPSFDLELPVDATYPTEHITRELVDKVIPQFLGEIWQVPPVYVITSYSIHYTKLYEHWKHALWKRFWFFLSAML